MNRVLTEQLVYEILSVVEEIPEGRVASYGQIARLIGRERNARLGCKFRGAHGALLARTARASFGGRRRI